MSLGRNHHRWSTIGDPFHWRPPFIGDPHGHLVGDPQILVGDPHIFIEDPRNFIGDPCFSLETLYFRWRPPDL